jgi:hypothetical protein
MPSAQKYGLYDKCIPHVSTSIRPRRVILMGYLVHFTLSVESETLCLQMSIIQGVQKVVQPMAYLESVSPGRLISKRLWLPRSPDLSPPDFFLWGHLKDTVYSNHSHTLQELEANIQRTVDRISTGTLQNVFAKMIRRVHLCEE